MKATEHVAKLKQLLELVDERVSRTAKLRTLFPTIEASIKAGLSYKQILHDLSEAGLEIKYGLFKDEIYRWRKSQRAKTEPSQQPSNTVGATKQPNSVNKPTAPLSNQPPRIKNPADLRELRDTQFDLDALRREGEAMKKANKD